MSTTDWYNTHADRFFDDTVAVDLSALHDRFLAHLPPGGLILDAGCGSGRDSLAFQKRGYAVQAFDLSEELARKAGALIAQEVGVHGFDAVEPLPVYDGIWACASLLHVPEADLPSTLARLGAALRPGGVLYLSFKEGQGERHKDGRWFTDATEESIRSWLRPAPELLPMEFWVTADQRPGRQSERWVNGLLRRRDGAPRLLTGSGGEPLLNPLCEAISRSARIDLAVAFVRQSGLDLLLPDLTAALSAHEGRPPARMRLLTSDYLDITDPLALRHLLLLSDRGADVRVFETRGQAGQLHGFHLKAYLFAEGDPASGLRGTAFVGSSNISRQALREGLEWNVRLEYPGDDAYLEAREAFRALLDHPHVKPLTHDWIRAYEARRRPPQRQRPLPTHQLEAESDDLPPAPEPNTVQQQALAALAQSRAQGQSRGLVVLATGLGKTWLAAFDVQQSGAQRVLFVAHREEILQQAAATFLRIRPEARAGFYQGQTRDVEADLLFASVQTLGRQAHLDRFASDHFDYIVVDEFHHASAATYRRLLRHFRPAYLLGLTATPDRTDQADLLSLCDDNLVFRRGLLEGVETGLLVPFDYFGICDESVDYAAIPWRNGRFDPDELTAKVATEARAAHAWREWTSKRQTRTLGFCVSIRHAQFMADWFQQRGVACAAVYGGSSLGRGRALEMLARRELELLFTVDLFNEGVDLPQIDTVLMLRPTESKILFLQQLGRGLRRAADKTRLVVLDFIGNHRAFLNRPQALLGLEPGLQALSGFAARVEAGTLDLPEGCHLVYDLRLIDFIRKMSSSGEEEAYRDLRERLGRRPTLLEFVRSGGRPAELRRQHGSWFELLRDEGDLDDSERRVLAQHSRFLKALEVERMTRSFKMVLLEAFQELGGWTTPVTLEALAEQSWHVMRRRPGLQAELADAVRQEQDGRSSSWQAYWRKNPVAAWIGETRAEGEAAWFELKADGRFGTRVEVEAEDADPLDGMVWEVVGWRLGERAGSGESLQGRIEGRVSRIGLPIGAEIAREEIPRLFGEVFNPGKWNSGQVPVLEGKGQVLLITLNKQGRATGTLQTDRWISESRFSWTSQASTQPTNRRGREVVQQQALGIVFHLFVRENKLRDGRASPFTYWGEVRYQDHTGSSPMQVEWELV